MSERKPLLSDDDIATLGIRTVADGHTGIRTVREMTGHMVRKFYEDRIDRGELMVVKRATIIGDGNCSECGAVITDEDDLKPGDFHKCGAKIFEP